MSAAAENARAAWASRGREMPEWVGALALECAASSQNKVAAALGRSGSLVSQVLAGKYPGDLAAVRERFEGVYRSMRVECPSLGLMPMNECGDWRDKARFFNPVNPLRVRMYRACKACPRNRKSEDEGDAGDE